MCCKHWIQNYTKNNSVVYFKTILIFVFLFLQASAYAVPMTELDLLPQSQSNKNAVSVGRTYEDKLQEMAEQSLQKEGHQLSETNKPRSNDNPNKFELKLDRSTNPDALINSQYTGNQRNQQNSNHSLIDMLDPEFKQEAKELIKSIKDPIKLKAIEYDLIEHGVKDNSFSGRGKNSVIDQVSVTYDGGIQMKSFDTSSFSVQEPSNWSKNQPKTQFDNGEEGWYLTNQFYKKLKMSLLIILCVYILYKSFAWLIRKNS